MHRLFPWPIDRLHLAFFGLQALLTIVARPSFPGWLPWLAFDLGVIGVLAGFNAWSARRSPRVGAGLRLLHGMVAVPLVFTQVGLLIGALSDRDYASALWEADRWLFAGHNPLEALESIATPWLTELMQLAYTAYVGMAPAVIILMLKRGSVPFIARSLFGLLSVFFLSYVGYYLWPTSGPNIHNNFGPLLPCGVDPLPLYHFETNLPGYGLAEELRLWMFQVELTKRDCFPSGHVAVAVATWIYARRLSRPAGFIFAILALGVVSSTMYLRYHYVWDVIAGIGLGVFCPTVLDAWHRRREHRWSIT